MKKKRWIAAGLAAVMTLSLAACESSGGDSDSGSDSGGKKKISMSVWNGNWAEDLQAFEDDFNSKNDDIELDVMMQTGDYADWLGASTASNDLPDIYLLTPYAQVQSFAQAGRIMDLSDESFVDKVYPQALDSATGADGKIYAYPANYEYLGVFYNKTLFEQAGIESVPTTPDEFKEVCEKLEAAGIKPLGGTFKESWTLKHLFSELLTPFVQDDISGFIDSLNSGKGTFDVEGIDQVFDFLDIVKEYAVDNMMDQDSNAGYNALANGEVAMLLTGEFSLTTVAAADPVQEIGVFATPVSDDPSQNKLSVDVGICYVINSETEYPDECRRVLEYMSNPDEEGGYMQLVSQDPGDAMPAMPFDGGVESPARTDYEAYVDAGNTIPWVYQQYTAGFDVESGDIIQGYMSGAADRDTIIKQLDEAYLNYIAE
jgi:raffinose/stachyose/melibiose transport system substrate-binding protein